MGKQLLEEWIEQQACAAEELLTEEMYYDHMLVKACELLGLPYNDPVRTRTQEEQITNVCVQLFDAILLHMVSTNMTARLVELPEER